MERWRMRLVIAAWLALAVVGLGCRSGPSVADDSAAIRELLHGHYRDFTARDWQSYGARFWPDASITTVWRPVAEDRDRVVATRVAEFVARAPAEQAGSERYAESMADAEIRVFGSLAQAWVSTETEFGEPGAERRWDGVDAFIFLKHEGAWRIAALVFTADDS
jgi:hypothetical protein